MPQKLTPLAIIYDFDGTLDLPPIVVPQVMRHW